MVFYHLTLKVIIKVIVDDRTFTLVLRSDVMNFVLRQFLSVSNWIQRNF